MRFTPNALDEREFEKRHISTKMERYLETDVIERTKSDRGYSAKMELLESFVRGGTEGELILDVGANTCGEAEVLAEYGYRIVATDINEVALGFSQTRANKFRERVPTYITADAHRLPFADAVFAKAIAFEVLHHFEHVDKALGEIYRVLRPGGQLFAFEPYAFNPYRRLAELRFLLLGSIERSFSKRRLNGILESAGFEVESIRKAVLPPSEWKKKYVSKPRALLKDAYYRVSKSALPLFGNLVCIARKPGVFDTADAADIYNHLICPITGTRLARTPDGYISSSVEGVQYAYGNHEGIPVLVGEDAKLVSGNRLGSEEQPVLG